MSGIEDLGDQLVSVIHHGVAAAIGRPLERKSKDEVDYGIPAEDEVGKCGNCRHFEHPDECHLVEGEIDPEDICDLYEARKVQVMGPDLGR